MQHSCSPDGFTGYSVPVLLMGSQDAVFLPFRASFYTIFRKIFGRHKGLCTAGVMVSSGVLHVNIVAPVDHLVCVSSICW